MALMAAEGAFGRIPDCAIFADTGWEPPHVYSHLDWLTTQLSYPVHRASLGQSLRDNMAEITTYTGNSGYIDIPVFLKGSTPAENGIGKRQCTRAYKIKPIRRKVRELIGAGPRGRVTTRVEQWMGISTDEAMRMKDSDVGWITNRYPLVEANMSRRDCLDWWASRYDRPLAKSACVGCPYQTKSRWLETKERYPEVFADLVEIDANLRDSGLRYAREAYLHPARLPLDEAVELAAAQGRFEIDGFGNECEGHCGV